MTSYCVAASAHPLHQRYHDAEYGFPIREDAALFERLALEINQAGLSWLTILKKQDAFRRAFDGFDLDTVAAYGAAERARLLDDAGIIRNRLKVDAVIENARRLVAIRAEHGSFAAWLDAHHPLDQAAWQRLFKRTFVFTGGEIVREFLVSTGYLPGAHDPDCPTFGRVALLIPPWLRAHPVLLNFGWLVDGRVAGMARPLLEDAIALLPTLGIRAVVSLTEEPLSPDHLARHGLRSAHIPVPDRSAPTLEQVRQAVSAMEGFLADSRPVTVHCAAGLGRTGTILACYLVQQGRSAAEAITLVRSRRPGSIETAEQAAVVAAYARCLAGDDEHAPP